MRKLITILLVTLFLSSAVYADDKLTKQALDTMKKATRFMVENVATNGGGGALISGFAKARCHYGKVKVDQIDATAADLVCTPCVNCFDAIDELAKHYERPWKAIHLWALLANALVFDDG